MGWLRYRLSFSLLRSSIMCIRGARSSLHCFERQATIPIDLVAQESGLSCILNLVFTNQYTYNLHFSILTLSFCIFIVSEYYTFLSVKKKKKGCMEHSTLNLLNYVCTKCVPRPLTAKIIVSISEGRHIHLRLSIFDHRSSTFDHRSSTFDHRSSTIDHRPSTIDHRPSIIDIRPSTIDLRPSIFASTFDHRPSIFDLRPSIIASIFDHRSSNIDLRTPIFEDRRWKHRTDNPTSH